MNPGDISNTGQVSQRRSWRVRTLVVGVALAAIFSLLLLAFGRGPLLRGSPDKTKDDDAANLADGIPLRIAPLVRAMFARDSAEAVCVLVAYCKDRRWGQCMYLIVATYSDCMVSMLCITLVLTPGLMSWPP